MAHNLYFRMQSSSIVIARSKTTKQSPLVGQSHEARDNLSIGMTGKMPVPPKMRLLRAGALAVSPVMHSNESWRPFIVSRLRIDEYICSD